MAKQKKIPGTEDPNVPPMMVEKGDAYYTTLRKRQKLQEQEESMKEELVALGAEHGVAKIDTGDVIITLVPESKVKVKCKLKKDGE